ncbi:hypothetical protein Dimus_028791 [Dionaea muscipula]
MIGLVKELNLTFGASFVWLVCSVYFIQGFSSSESIAISYHLKDVLKLSPSASQFVSAITTLPWSIKPLYGILSDCIPIRGRRRIPYMVIATVLSLLPSLLFGLNASLRTLTLPLTIFLTLQNIGLSMAKLMVDIMLAEAVRFKRAIFADHLEFIASFSLAIGGVCGSLVVAYSLSKLHIDTVFLAFGAAPFLQLISCGFVKDTPVSTEVTSEVDDSTNSRLPIGNDNTKHEDDFALHKSSLSTKRRRKGEKNHKRKSASSSKVLTEGNGGPLVLQWFHSLEMGTYSLINAFRQPMVLRPMAWFFLAHVTMPNLSTIMFYYETEFLKLEASFLGTMRFVSWLGIILGGLTYGEYLMKEKLRRILMWAQIGLSAVSLLDIVIVSRLNIAYGISDRVMVLLGSALLAAIKQFKTLSFINLSARLCPPSETTILASFMSIHNFGYSVGLFLGAGMASALEISLGSFDNLLHGVIIQFVCTFIPVAFLFLIPADATGLP